METWIPCPRHQVCHILSWVRWGLLHHRNKTHRPFRIGSRKDRDGLFSSKNSPLTKITDSGGFARNLYGIALLTRWKPRVSPHFWPNKRPPKRSAQIRWWPAKPTRAQRYQRLGFRRFGSKNDGIFTYPKRDSIGLSRSPENFNLVGGFNPLEKYESKWESSPNRGENPKYFETTTQ